MNKERNYVFKGMMQSGNYRQQVIPDNREKYSISVANGEIFEFTGLRLIDVDEVAEDLDEDKK